MNEFSCRVCGKTFIESLDGLTEKTFHELQHGDSINEK